jgi:hypothetical protein
MGAKARGASIAVFTFTQPSNKPCTCIKTASIGLQGSGCGNRVRYKRSAVIGNLGYLQPLFASDWPPLP